MQRGAFLECEGGMDPATRVLSTDQDCREEEGQSLTMYQGESGEGSTAEGEHGEDKRWDDGGDEEGEERKRRAGSNPLTRVSISPDGCPRIGECGSAGQSRAKGD